MSDILINFLPEIITGVIALLLGWLSPNPKYIKIKKAGKILFDAIEDDEISSKEERAIASSFKDIFNKG